MMRAFNKHKNHLRAAANLAEKCEAGCSIVCQTQDIQISDCKGKVAVKDNERSGLKSASFFQNQTQDSISLDLGTKM